MYYQTNARQFQFLTFCNCVIQIGTIEYSLSKTLKSQTPKYIQKRSLTSMIDNDLQL